MITVKKKMILEGSLEAKKWVGLIIHISIRIFNTGYYTRRAGSRRMRAINITIVLT